MNIEEIAKKITKSIERISDDNSLVWHDTEWNICHHIACELNVEFADYNIDVELRKDDARRPDIVIHKKGVNSDNFVVIQVKKRPSTKDVKNDLDKIKNTFFRDPYNYRFGIFISVSELPKKMPEFDKDRIKIINISGWEIIPVLQN